MQRKGLYIAFEGIDGCGKTTQVKRVAEELRKIGHDVLTFREPGGTAVGEEIRDIVKNPEYQDKIFPMTSLLLFTASRYQFIHEKVKPALEEGKIILADRCFLSALVYQGRGEGINRSIVRSDCMRALDGAMPDKIFVLDVPEEEAKKRLAKENKNDRYEKMGDQFLARVRQGFIEESRMFPKLTCFLSAHFPEEKVTEDIMKNVRMLIR